MYWFFEEMACPHKGVETVAALQNRVWQDQSLVERATRRDNLHLQVLLHDLARWETPADHYFHMVANAASADVRTPFHLTITLLNDNSTPLSSHPLSSTIPSLLRLSHSQSSPTHTPPSVRASPEPPPALDPPPPHSRAKPPTAPPNPLRAKATGA